MKTPIKHFNRFLVVILVVAALFGAIRSFFIVKSKGAPAYEIVDLDLSFPYEFTTSEGQKVQSTYVVALHNGKPVAYDPVYGKVASFNASYMNEIESVVPKSNYNFFQRHISIFAWIIAIAIFALLLFVAWVIRDCLLALFVSVSRGFTDSTYFLSDFRFVGEKMAEKVFSEKVDSFVKEKSIEIQNKYPESASFILGLLEHIKFVGSPKILYSLEFDNQTESDQQKCLDRMIRYWEQRVSIEESAKDKIEYLRKLKEKDYVDLCVFTKVDDIKDSVSNELDSFFEKLMGDRVFSFYYHKYRHGELKVSIVLQNGVSSFTWSGLYYSGKSFPGIDIHFTISTNDGSQKILWQKWLSPVCNYSSSDESFTVSGLYDAMVKQTIGSFTSQF